MALNQKTELPIQWDQQTYQHSQINSMREPITRQATKTKQYNTTHCYLQLTVQAIQTYYKPLYKYATVSQALGTRSNICIQTNYSAWTSNQKQKENANMETRSCNKSRSLDLQKQLFHRVQQLCMQDMGPLHLL